jgi:uncharacterized protein YecT (DUF1311 family)
MNEQYPRIFSTLLACAAAVFVTAAASPAEPSAQADPYYRCMAAAGGNTKDLINCGIDEFERDDRVLGKTYLSVQKNLSPAKRRDLQMLQRRWVEARDRTCLQEEIEVGGTLGTITGQACLFAETNKRIAWLREFR